MYADRSSSALGADRAGDSSEELEIRLGDGTRLRADCNEPAAPTASIVLAHAMFARKSSLRGLARSLSGRGYRTLAFDFRGHGDSSHVDYGYDDLISGDLPAVVECVRARADEGHPVVVLGHSLGAHVAIAAQGTKRMHADAIVMLGGGFWLEALEPSRLRWAAKKAIARATLEIAERMGRVPASNVRFGTDDASQRYIQGLFRGVTDGRWASDDGVDYLAAAADVDVPVASILGKKDRIMCHPEAGSAFARRVSGPIRIFEANADHMDLRHEHAAVAEAIAWALEQSALQARP